jgi:hypothetical protein
LLADSFDDPPVISCAKRVHFRYLQRLFPKTSCSFCGHNPFSPVCDVPRQFESARVCFSKQVPNRKFQRGSGCFRSYPIGLKYHQPCQMSSFIGALLYRLVGVHPSTQSGPEDWDARGAENTAGGTGGPKINPSCASIHYTTARMQGM